MHATCDGVGECRGSGGHWCPSHHSRPYLFAMTSYYRGMKLVASKPQRSSCFHLTVCGDLFIYILILLIFIYVSVWVCLLVCVCTSSTPLETSSSGSYTCRKKRVAGRTALPECAPAPGWEIPKERWPLLNSKGRQASSMDWNPAEAFI